MVDFASRHGLSVEVGPDGKILHTSEVQGAIVYRAFRVNDLYSTSAAK